MSLFNPESGAAKPVNLIPAGELCFVKVGVRKINNSKETGGEYFDLELRVVGGPYHGRVVFDMLCSPFDTRNSEAWRAMGITGITRALEAAKVFVPEKPETYNMFNDLPTGTPEEIHKASQTLAHELDASLVAIKVKIEKGQDGYADKNKVGEWLSPNPKSGGYKLFQKLVELSQTWEQAGEQARSGAFGGRPQQNSAPAAAAPAGAATGAAPATASADTPAWLKDAQSKQADSTPY